MHVRKIEIAIWSEIEISLSQNEREKTVGGIAWRVACVGSSPAPTASVRAAHPGRGQPISCGSLCAQEPAGGGRQLFAMLLSHQPHVSVAERDLTPFSTATTTLTYSYIYGIAR